MRLRLFALVFLLTVLTLLPPTGGAPAAAQDQAVAPPAPAHPAPDRAQVSAVLRNSPVMFIENVGRSTNVPGSKGRAARLDGIHARCYNHKRE